MRTIRALCLPLLSAAGLSLLPTNAHAQAATTSAAQSGEFTVQRFEPAPGTNNFLSVEGVRMDGRWGFSAGVLFDYARNPFSVQSCATKTDCASPNATNATDTHVVSDMFTWSLMAAVSPAKFLQVGVRLPLVYVSGEGINPETGRGAKDGLKTFALGDTMLEGKVRVLGGAQDPYLLGLAADLSFPTGHATGGEGSYVGNSSPITGGIRAIFDAHIKAFSLGANLRGVFRESGTLGTTTIGPVDFRYGLGAGYRVSPIFKVLAEGFGSTQFQFKRGTNGLEALAAVEVRPLNLPLSFRANGGAGILSGVGVPVARALVGITYIHEIGDQDGDGIADDKDACPTIAEDKDGFEDEDGCPDLDNDADGIPDRTDKCPMEPEDKDGFEDDDGCPDLDNDKDSFADKDDKCPNEFGVAPDGCPKKYTNVVVTATKIEIKQTIFFEFNKATIKPVSFPLLNEVAQALKDNPKINVEVGGHTDSQGNDKANLKLSQNRANSVRKYLIGQGVAAERMTAKGYGENVMIADNRT
ncbi:MAG: OmpA family protein, partial [Minicystis sp.]